MAIKDRMNRYRTEGAGADLVRVEVLVPVTAKRAILDLAAQIREEHRREKFSAELAALHRQAIERFGTGCLGNMKPSASPAGMAVVAEQLRKYGGMEAWRLAARIKEALRNAA